MKMHIHEFTSILRACRLYFLTFLLVLFVMNSLSSVSPYRKKPTYVLDKTCSWLSHPCRITITHAYWSRRCNIDDVEGLIIHQDYKDINTCGRNYFLTNGLGFNSRVRPVTFFEGRQCSSNIPNFLNSCTKRTSSEPNPQLTNQLKVSNTEI